MKCTCPKCHAKIEIEVTEVTEAGTPVACPACNARFNLYRESFGSRALHRNDAISCAPCGEELGPYLHCPSCGALFPDFVVAQIGRKKARNKGKKVKLSGSPFSLPQRTTPQLPTLDAAYKADTEKTTKRPVLAQRAPKGLLIWVAALVVIVLAAGGTMYYKKHQAEKSYSKSFAIATYCLQVGIDKAQKIAARTATEWKQRADAGQAYQPRPGIEEERGFAMVEAKLNQAMSKLDQPPERFASCNEKLTKLKEVYNKWRALALAPGNSLQGLTENTAKLDAEYKQAAREFKSGMPPEMMEDLVKASLKLKILRTLLQ